MEDHPLTVGANAHSDRLHASFAFGGAVTGSFIQMDTPQTPGTVVAMPGPGGIQGKFASAVTAFDVCGRAGKFAMTGITEIGFGHESDWQAGKHRTPCLPRGEHTGRKFRRGSGLLRPEGSTGYPAHLPGTGRVEPGGKIRPTQFVLSSTWPKRNSQSRCQGPVFGSSKSRSRSRRKLRARYKRVSTALIEQARTADASA